MDSARSRVHPLQALAVYAESLAAGGGVALFGDASLGLGERLVDLGARSVHVWDPDPVRARAEAEHAPQGVTVRAYGDVAAPRHEVDLAIVADLGLFPDASEVIARSRDLVGESGVVLLGATNRDAAASSEARAFEYYELFDLVARDFKGVTMIAELPFHGVALVALGEDGDASEVSVDTQLAGDARVPHRFLVVASQREVELDPYTVVELPGAGATEASELADKARVLAERAAKEEAAHAERSAKLEASLVARDRQLLELSSQVEQLRAAAQASDAAARQRDAAPRSDGAEARVAALELELARLAEANANEVRRFEDMLTERSRNARSLQLEVERRDQMVRELVDRLKDRGSAPAAPEAQPPADGGPSADDLSEENSRLRELLDASALEAARRESEARAMGWTVSELERRLQHALEVPPGSPQSAEVVAHPPPTNSR